MKYRQQYWFDIPFSSWWEECKVHSSHRTMDGEIWWCTSGAHDGYRVLLVWHEGSLYWADRLHSSYSVKMDEGEAYRAMVYLRKVAQYCHEIPMCRVVEDEDHPGQRKLIGPKGNTPLGFRPTRSPAPLRHKDGWFTRSEWMLWLSPPDWAPDARVWDIREGVYLEFPDGSCRLIRRRDYYRFCHRSGIVVGRQGDLLLMNTFSDRAFVGDEEDTPFPFQISRRCIEGGNAEWIVTINRHVIDWGKKTITHPEHGIYRIPQEAKVVVLMPGASIPFGRGIGD